MYENDKYQALFKSFAELHLSLENGIARLEELKVQGDPTDLPSDALLEAYRAALAELDRLGDVYAALASEGVSRAEWLHNTISKAVRPASSLHADPEGAVRSGHHAVLRALDDIIERIVDDPARGILEHMKSDLRDIMMPA